MTDQRWGAARAAFAECFAPLGAAGFTLERLPDAAAYWRRHEETLARDFPREVFFDLRAARGPAAAAAAAALDAERDDHPLTDFHVVRDGDQVAAMFAGEQRSRGVYRMWHTNVAVAYRRRGLYRQILSSTIAYTRGLGFAQITSEHAPSNNPVIIAKLAAGFRIYGFEIDPSGGPSLILRYFHQAADLAAYELRCGLATLTPELRAAGAGAYAEFVAQVRGDGAP
jgi:L-amino acid N-acyltransferase YncA